MSRGRPPSYRPAEDALIVEACLPRAERLRRLAGELGRTPDALAKRGARVIASGVADTTTTDPWNAILDADAAGCALHLSARDVARLADDDAIQRAALDLAIRAEWER